MRKFTFRFLTSALLALSACAAEQGGGGRGAASQPPPAPTQAEAAEQGLNTLQKIVTPQNYAGLGFASPEDVRRAQLASPMPVYRVELNTLRQMGPGTPVMTVIVDARRSLYPVSVDGRVATSLFVMRHNDGWRATDFGSAAVARATAAYGRAPDDIIVWIPAAKLYFIGRRLGPNLTLTPVMDDPRFDFKAGETLPAQRALLRVQRGMAGYNGLPQ
jgi:hypothetical protein